jgi:hypothetical protein
VAQDNPGILGSAQDVGPGVAAILVLDRSPATLGIPAWTVVTSSTPLPRGAPIFLLTRTLRL